MTPIEALVQIVQTAELNPAASVNGLGRLARVALRESGEHGVLSCVGLVPQYRVTCYCGWQFTFDPHGLSAEQIIVQHALAMAGEL